MPKYLSNVDLSKNQLLNAVVHKAASAPASPVEGQIYYDTTVHSFFFYSGTQWVNASSVDLSPYLTKATYDANTVLAATTNDTPAAVTINEQTVLGRATGGNITALSILSDLSGAIANDDSLPSAKVVKTALSGKQASLTFGIANTNAVQVNDAAVTAGDYAMFTATGVEGKTKAEVVTDLAVIPTSYLDTDNTLAANSDTKISTQKAVKSYIDGNIAAANALVYKGVIDCSTNPNYPAADAGWSYVVSVAGKIGGASGTTVEVGDMLMCKTDSTAAGDQATVGAQWNIVEKNNTGAVAGPASSIDLHLAVFNGTTGKAIADSGVTVASIQNATHTGDVTGSGALTIAAKAVTLAKMDDLAALSIIGNNTAGATVPKALTATEVRTLLNVADGATSNIGDVRKAAASVGDGAASTFVITHNLNSRDVQVSVYETASPYAQVFVDYENTDANNTTLKFGAAPTSNQYRAVIMS